MIKKWIGSLAMALFVTSILSFQPVFAADPIHPTSRIEAMLVVDVSNSMLTSDPNAISSEAMKMFIDMSSVKGDKIGVIAYADEVMRETALIPIRSEQNKNDLKSFIDSLAKYPYTDISVGVNEAVKRLDMGHEEAYYPLIILLADGNNDLNKAKMKTVKQAEEDLAKAVEAAKSKNYPIYTIGLNAGGILNKEALQMVAETTNGRFFETATADSLPGILSEIFANHLKLKVVPLEQLTANGDFQEVIINVPNQNVIEANISMISNQPVEVQLVDPSGADQIIPSENLLLSTSKSYSILKLINPVQGDWTLKVKGVPKDKIDINLVFNYDLQLKLAPLAKSYRNGDTVKISSFFEDNGQPLTNKELYQNMKATLFVKDIKKGTTEEIPLAAKNGFTGEFQLGASEEYEVKIKAEDNSFFRESEAQTIMVQKVAAPAAIKESPGEVEENSFSWHLLLAGFLLLTFILAYFLFGKKTKRGFSGQIVIEIKDEDTGERSSPQYKKLKTFTGKFRLHQLLSLSPEFSDTDQITFKPLAGDMLLLVNHSTCTIEKAGRAIDAKKGMQIKRNDRLRINLKKVNKSIYIEYIS
jgi:Ca-activated chloride channel homolog